MRVSGTCLGSLPCAMPSGSGAQGFSAQQRALADEGEVVVAAGGVRDGSAAVSRDIQVGHVPNGAAVDRDPAAPGVANADGITGIATAVDVADGDRATIGRRGGNPTVAGGGDVACARIATAEELVLQLSLSCCLRHTGETHCGTGHCGTHFSIHVLAPSSYIPDTAICRIHAICTTIDVHCPAHPP